MSALRELSEWTGGLADFARRSCSFAGIADEFSRQQRFFDGALAHLLNCQHVAGEA
jgi:hypothetical protein